MSDHQLTPASDDLADTTPSNPHGGARGPTPPPQLVVDGDRPGVAWVASLPRSYKLSESERLVLLALACDSFDGYESAPTMDGLAAWCGLLRSSLYKIVQRLERPTKHRPSLLERESTGGRNRTVFRLLRTTPEPFAQPSGVNGRLDGDNRPLTPDGSNRPADRPTPPDGWTPQPSGEPSGGPSGVAGPRPYPYPKHACKGDPCEHDVDVDEPAPPPVEPPPLDDQLAEIRTRHIEALTAVILDQPHGERLNGRTHYAQRLRDAGWTPEALAAEFVAVPLVGAQGAGLLRSRLEPLIASGPTRELAAAAVAGPERSACPVHERSFAGTCPGCAGDHHGGDHRAEPSSACHLCARSAASAGTPHGQHAGLEGAGLVDAVGQPAQYQRGPFMVIQGGRTA